MVAPRIKRSNLSSPIQRVPIAFQRTGVAYTFNGDTVPTNTPIFEHKIPDVTVTNLLTGNQSDGGDTLNPELLTLNQRTGTDTLSNTTGFFQFKGDEVLSSSTEQAHSGTKSLKVVTDGSHVNEGAYISQSGLTATGTYISGVWVYAPLNANMAMYHYDDAAVWSHTPFTGTGTWQWVEKSVTMAGTTLNMYICTHDDTAAVTFFVDDLRLAKTDTTGYTSVNAATLSVTGETSYQRYRSLKVTTAGTTANEGFYANKSGLTALSPYIGQFRIKLPVGKQVRYLLLNAASETVYTEYITGTGNWQFVSGGGTPASGTVTYIMVYTRYQEAYSFYIDQVMLETGTTAHDWAYGGSSYSSYKTVQGCGVYEAHTNLLTANQSTATDTLNDTTGLTGLQTTETVSSTTTEYLQGNKCLKIVTPGNVSDEGLSCYHNTTGTVTVQGWVKGTLGTVISIRNSGNGTKSYYTLTGGWDFITVTSTVAASQRMVIGTVHQVATTLYIDMLQVTASAYPLPWGLGGTTVAAETLTAPSTVLNIDTSGGASNGGTGTIELECYTTNKSAAGYLCETYSTETKNRIVVYVNASNNYYIYTVDNAEANSSSGGSGTTVGFHKFSAVWDVNSSKMFIDGVQIGSTTATPKLPSAKGTTLTIGSRNNAAASWINSIIKNFTVSRPKRTDTTITNRASNASGFGVDRFVTLYAPLINNLKAYKFD